MKIWKDEVNESWIEVEEVLGRRREMEEEGEKKRVENRR
jgi:hypothetical protein